MKYFILPLKLLHFWYHLDFYRIDMVKIVKTLGLQKNGWHGTRRGAPKNFEALLAQACEEWYSCCMTNHDIIIEGQIDPEFKERWLAALRSGQYTKGRGTLRAVHIDGTSEFCCLGVACDLIDPDGWHNLPNMGTWRPAWRDVYPISTDMPFLAGVTVTRNLFRFLVGDILAATNDRTSTFDAVIEFIETKL